MRPHKVRSPSERGAVSWGSARNGYGEPARAQPCRRLCRGTRGESGQGRVETGRGGGRRGVGGGNGRRAVPFFRGRVPTKPQLWPLQQRHGARAGEGERGSPAPAGSATGAAARGSGRRAQEPASGSVPHCDRVPLTHDGVIFFFKISSNIATHSTACYLRSYPLLFDTKTSQL